MFYQTKIIYFFVFIVLIANVSSGYAIAQDILPKKDLREAHADYLNQVQLLYEEKVDDKPCTHCPKYVNLTQAVNKIIEKTKNSTESIAESNESTIQLNKLKFMYYVVRSENDNGDIQCKQVGEQNHPFSNKSDGNLKLLSESILKMSNVTDIQYIPQGKDEVYYYYRGEGEQSNTLIEAVMNKDGSSKIRRYNYTPAHDPNALPDIISTEENDFNPTWKHKFTDKEQSATAGIQSAGAKKWADVEVKNVTKGEKSLNLVIPLEINLTDNSDNMKLKGSIENKVISSDFKSSNNKTTLKLGLTDHNSEYISVKTVLKDGEVVGHQVANKIGIGDGNSIGASYEQTEGGNRVLNLQATANLGDYGKVSATVGTTDGNKEHVEAKYEKKIDDAISMVLTVKSDDNGNVNLLYQVQAKL